MANIVALMFEGAETAESMLDNFMEMQEKGIIELEDAVVASRGPGTEVKVKQTHSVTGKYTLRGSGVGLLAGLLLGGPIGGLVGGAAVGAIAGKMKDIGIDDDFVKNTSTALAPNTSAIFLMVKEANAEEVLAELKPFKGIVLTSTLTDEQEKVLRKTLEREE
jgi:uncharacterized membrane protein